MIQEEVNVKEISKESILSKYIYLFIKRLFDIFCSLLGIILMLPISIIIKLSYILTGDFHSIFYKQQRIGKDGKIIGIYKFRSMVYNADELLKEVIKKEPYKTEWKKNHKLENDPRITKVGKLIRKTSIDELPQFINVLFNEMSLIGPRPLVKGELDQHGGDHELYESIKPGITGWWACNGRSALDYDKRLELEYYYINNRSLLLDIKCILLTISIVINRHGVK